MGAAGSLKLDDRRCPSREPAVDLGHCSASLLLMARDRTMLFTGAEKQRVCWGAGITWFARVIADGRIMTHETEIANAHWVWKAVACVVGLVGIYLVFIFFQCLYFMFVRHVRAFFPLFGYPVLLILGYLFLQTPFLVFRKYGPRARIQTVACSMLAGAIIVISLGPLLLFGGLNDFEDEFLNAVWDGDVETVDKMLADGVNPNKRDSCGNTPMTLAGYAGQTEVARVLLQHGEDIQSSDGSGMTPLHCAAYYNRIDTARFLLSQNADVTATNHYGETPRAIAEQKGFSKMAELLKNYEENRVGT